MMSVLIMADISAIGPKELSIKHYFKALAKNVLKHKVKHLKKCFKHHKTRTFYFLWQIGIVWQSASRIIVIRYF